MPEIAAVQSSFRAGIAGSPVPEGVTAPEPTDLERRFSVYRNNVMSSLTNALRQRFPVVERLVGEEFAKALFAEFIRQHPPQSPLMMKYGGELADFIRGFSPVSSLPYLADVARLEFSRGVAYHAADAGPIRMDELSRGAAGDAEAFGLALHPSVQVLVSPFPIHTIWDSNQPGRTPVRISASEPEAVLVARDGFTVVTERLPQAEGIFLTGLIKGWNFIRAAEAGISVDEAFDPATSLARLLQMNLVVGLRQPCGQGDQTN